MAHRAHSPPSDFTALLTDSFGRNPTTQTNYGILLLIQRWVLESIDHCQSTVQFAMSPSVGNPDYWRGPEDDQIVYANDQDSGDEASQRRARRRASDLLRVATRNNNSHPTFARPTRW